MPPLRRRRAISGKALQGSDIRSRLRSAPSAGAAVLVEEPDPELILRRARGPRAAQKTTRRHQVRQVQAGQEEQSQAPPHLDQDQPESQTQATKLEHTSASETGPDSPQAVFHEALAEQPDCQVQADQKEESQTPPQSGQLQQPSSPQARLSASLTDHASPSPQEQDPPERLTQEALAGLEQCYSPGPKVHYPNGIEVPAKDPDDEADLDLSDYADPWETWYEEMGYLPPISADSADTTMAPAKDDRRVEKLKEIRARSILRFGKGLGLRNVSTNPEEHSDQEFRLMFDNMCDNNPLTPPSLTEEAIWRWDEDLRKCLAGGNEALFQRTNLMDLILRTSFIYKSHGVQPILDYSVEEPWTCPPMLSRVMVSSQRGLTQPKPDLAVSFIRNAVIPNELWNYLPLTTQTLVCSEKFLMVEGPSGPNRLFHFLIVEVKKYSACMGPEEAQLQSLNAASQSLFNMFAFCKDAGQTHLDRFFEKARVFSISGDSRQLTIYVHRAVKLDRPKAAALVIPDAPDYAVRYEHETYCTVKGADLKLEKVSEIMQKIMITYGVGILLPLLQDAAADLVAKIIDSSQAEREKRENPEYYYFGFTRKRRPASMAVTQPTGDSAVAVSSPVAGTAIRGKSVLGVNETQSPKSVRNAIIRKWRLGLR